MTVMWAAVLIAVVIAVSMPRVHDYSMELKNIDYQLSRIANTLDKLVILIEKRCEADGND